jgi:signal transduction histidine kinase
MSTETMPHELQSRVRRLLQDPHAEFLMWSGNPVWAYTDVDGRRRELDDLAPDRTITAVQREGRPLGAIVHDRARFDADLLERVATTVGLEVERDRYLYELEQSERRSRALLDAMPDKMFRVRRDGLILDIQENPDRSWPGAPNVRVGCSAYDAGVPREVVERVMTAGRLALETGELQTLEWELGVVGDMRHVEGRFIPSGDEEFLAVIRDVTQRKRHEVEQAALHRVAVAVAAESGSERLFDLVTEEVGRVLEAHSANLLRYDEDGSGSVIVGRWSEPGAYAGPIGHRFPSQAGTVAHTVYTTGRPVRLQLDGGTDAAFADYMRRIGAHSVVAAPITVEGRLWGVIAARLSPPHTFPAGAEERMEGFTRLVSLALANEETRAQLAASRARLVSTADAERRRLERNLHDGAQQRLVTLSLALRRAEAKLASDPDGAKTLVADARGELAVALEELRELARGIHPAVLVDRGLVPALQALADRSTLSVQTELHINGRLPERIEAAAYYLVSESLTNVAKYANASAVAVRLLLDEDGAVVVEVADDGVGGADPSHGSGLRGLIDRVEALGGTLSVRSRAGEGTTVRARLPVTRE